MMIRDFIKGFFVIILIVCVPLSAYPQDAEEFFRRGISLSEEDKFEEALMYVDRSLKMDSSLSQRFGFRAELKAKIGMIEEAIGDISRCIDKCKCPTRKYHVSDYYLERAELQLANELLSAAMEDVNKSILYNPDNWHAYNFRSALFVVKGQITSALTDLSKSISIYDNEALTFIARGKLRIKIGDLEGACSDMTKVSAWGIDDFDQWISENCGKY